MPGRMRFRELRARGGTGPPREFVRRRATARCPLFLSSLSWTVFRMRCVRICGGSGERNRKGRLLRASYGVPGIRGEAGARISQPWLKTVAEISRLRSRGITYRHLRKVPLPCLAESRLAKNRCALEQQFSQVTALVHPACYPGFREARQSALLPFSARATFHPDCTVGTGFSPVRPLLRAGASSGFLSPTVGRGIM